MQPPADKPVEPDVTAISASPAADAERPKVAAVADCDDGALARRIAKGDRAAAAELVDRYQGMVRGFLRKVCFDRDAIEDLSQETFVRALKYAHRFDPRYPMKTWLLTIARRLSINHGQKQKRRRGEPGRAGVPGEGSGVEPVWLEDETAASPSAEAERDERAGLSRSLLEDALEKLSEPQRVSIVMHYQEGLALEEIGRALDMPVGTVKSHLHRGRKKMRELLEPRSEDLLP